MCVFPSCKGFSSKVYINYDFLYDYDDHHHFKFREPIRVCTGNMGSDMLNNPGAALIVQGGLIIYHVYYQSPYPWQKHAYIKYAA